MGKVGPMGEMTQRAGAALADGAGQFAVKHLAPAPGLTTGGRMAPPARPTQLERPPAMSRSSSSRSAASTSSPAPSPLDLWQTASTFWTLAAEAQTVIALRTLGLMGLWNTGAAETERMVTEKTEAFAQAAQASVAALVRGERPDQVAMAGMKPLQRKTQQNVARLSKAGPKSLL